MSEAIWADGRSDEFKDGYSLGFHDGSKDDAIPILTDLIAELREEHARAACPDACGYQYDHCECGEEWDTGWDACMSMAATYQAEARLREVTDE